MQTIQQEGVISSFILPAGPESMKVRQLLRDDGWYLDRTRGDHRQLQHPSKPGTVTVSGHLRDDVHPKTLKSVLRQAGLENDE